MEPDSYLGILNNLIGEEVKISITDTLRATSKFWTGIFVVRGIKNPYQSFAGWQFVEFPGCCGILISTKAYVNPRYRRLGIGTLLNAMRICLAKTYGYTTLWCTDVESNIEENHILLKNNWKKIHTFLNCRTQNIVNTWAIPTADLGINSYGFDVNEFLRPQ